MERNAAQWSLAPRRCVVTSLVVQFGSVITQQSKRVPVYLCICYGTQYSEVFRFERRCPFVAHHLRRHNRPQVDCAVLQSQRSHDVVAPGCTMKCTVSIHDEFGHARFRGLQIASARGSAFKGLIAFKRCHGDGLLVMGVDQRLTAAVGAAPEISLQEHRHSRYRNQFRFQLFLHAHRVAKAYAAPAPTPTPMRVLGIPRPICTQA